MFESQSLLSRKGALRSVWEAAYFHKKLKKAQVTQTNISSSVDKILVDEVPVLAYRILGYILLGVVRIYSKKVEYLFDDCQKMLIKVKDFAVGKQFNADMEGFSAPCFSITLPKTFELDAFDLEVLEDVSGGNVRPQEEITLQDTLKNEGIRHYFLDQYRFEDVASQPETCSTISPPDEDFLLPCLMDTAQLVSSLHDLSSIEASMEKFRDCSFSQGECLDLQLFHRVEIDIGGPFDGEHHSNGEQTKSLEMASSENRRHQVTIECHSVPNTFDATPQSKLQVTAEGHRVTNTLDATPESNLPDASGSTTPEFIIVHTPTKKEHARIPRKRKCLFDEKIVLSSEFLKKSIQSSSDLIRKRRKVPHTAYDAWKVYQIANLSQGFLEALIPCISLELRSLFHAKKLMTPELVVNVEAPDGLVVPGSPTVNQLLKETAIAPETPAIHSTLMGVSEVHKLTDSDRVVPASSFESSQQRQSSSENEEFDILMNEEINSCEVANQKINGWSDRTGMVARYLCRSFLNQKKQGDENAVTLSQFLTGKTKKESSRLFYEILVLKSKGYVDVEQNNAYGDIRVMKTLQMESVSGKLKVSR